MKKVIEYSTPPDAPLPQRLRGIDLSNQWRVGFDVLRFGLFLPNLLNMARRKKTPVVLIPGWLAPEATMVPLKFFLQSRGYEARHWGLGTNNGTPERDSEIMADKVATLAQTTGRSVALVGWSLGGVIARETARLVPHAVAKVITYGTPVIGGPTYTLGASRWGKEECERIAQRIQELDATSPISVPIVAIFTRKDEIVSWPACIDRVSPNAKHFEVGSTHLSMGFDPDVWNIVAQELAEVATA